MGYFSKDVYDKKREWAYNVSNEGLEKIALYLVSENPKYKNADLDDEKISNEIDSELEDIIEELQPIAELSHKRHEIHSTDRDDFVYNSYDLEEVGTEYSDECLIDEVNRLNKKYDLVSFDVKLIDLVEPSFDTDTDEDILDYYGEDYEDLDEDDLHYNAHDLMYYDWNDKINEWSESVRKWYKELNKKFDCDFPS